MVLLVRILFILISISSLVIADDTLPYEIVIKDHLFQPDTINIKSNTRVTLRVCNQDSTVEEFESTDLKREKIIPSNSCINIRIAPLKAGVYNFFGEFHPETAIGKIIVENEVI